MGRTGRPLKYKNLIEQLADEKVYSAAMIAHLAEAVSDENPQLKQTRIRKTLNMFTRNNGFPQEGDGPVSLRGQEPGRGWFGWRWKAAVTKK